MKTVTKFLLVVGFFSLTSSWMHAQVAINNSAANPDASAILDLQSGNAGVNKGFLPQAIALTATDAAAPVIGPATGLIVYNTATAGSAPNNVVPGYYYWNGTSWAFILAPLPGTSGQVLTSNGGGAPSWANPLSPILLNLTEGTGIIPFTYNGSSAQSIGIANTTVAAGSYGDAAHYTTFTVNAQGQLTVAGVLALPTSLPPSGVAGGDLSGFYPNPTVIGIDGKSISGALVSGDYLLYNGSNWIYTAPSGGTVTSIAAGVSGGNSGGGLTFSSNPITSSGTIAIANTGVTAATYGSNIEVPQIIVNTQGQIISASNVAISASGIGAVTSISANTPVIITGTSTAPIVNVQGTNVNQGGVLYSAGTGNAAVFSATGITGQVLTSNGSSAPSWANPAPPILLNLTEGTGIIPFTYNGSSAQSIGIANTTVAAGSYGDAAHYTTFTVNAQGQLTVAGVLALPTSLPPSGAAGGDLSGFYPNPSVSGIQGASISGTLTPGDYLMYNGTNWVYAAPAGGGTVTSVGLTGPGGVFGITNTNGNPITTIGSFGITTSGTSGGITYFNSNTQVSSSALLTQYGVVYGGGAGGAPATTAAGTTGEVLMANTGGAPSWGPSPASYVRDSAWMLKGNAGTNANTNFIGTTDANDFVFKVNNIFSGIIDISYANCIFGYKAGRNDLLYFNRYNTAFGYEALTANTTGSGNTVMGCQALFSSTVASFNTAIGFNALNANTSGNSNTAVGYSALADDTSGLENTAVGFGALKLNTSGNNNTAIGYEALVSNTTGANNTATGYLSLWSNTTGTGNTVNGRQALHNNITGSDNDVTGYFALSYNTTGSHNTVDGYTAMLNNYTGCSNTAIGFDALYYSTGDYNTAIGDSALLGNSTGNYNTAIGYNAGIGIGGGTNATAIGYNAMVTASNNMVFGNSQVVGWGFGVAPGAGAITVGTSALNGDGATLTLGGVWTNASDSTKKHDIRNIPYGLSTVMKLHPVTYKMKGSNHQDIGFLAQEVKLVIPEIVYGQEGQMTLSYGQITSVLTKAVQEQQQIIDSLKNQVNQLKQQNIAQAHDKKDYDSRFEKDEKEIAELKEMIYSSTQVQVSAKTVKQ